MKIAFRADASLEIGTGHVMRCLTLGRALRERGHECLFISREHLGNLLTLISEEGFAMHALPVGNELDSELAHAKWLGASQTEDALACKELLASWCPDWLVVDHYGLDHRWEESVRPVGCRVLVIDDLADRQHSCDLLLDQNLGRSHCDYHGLLRQSCAVLTGPLYALLRPEFAELRADSLARREEGLLSKVLIALGGVDQHDYTRKILKALQACQLAGDIRFTVVLGATAPHLQVVREFAEQCPWPVEVLSGINNMAQHMATADLAIGAGGATSWERCCLGVPTLLLILAENQLPASRQLVTREAAIMIEVGGDLRAQLQQTFRLMSDCGTLRGYSSAASQITDGVGVERVLDIMSSISSS
ncbi:UDP-2,4-diacetamido-2,4,6-trideoxy-beta-L-altropyranose hydrolase [Ectopseudomonas alcaliphila]|uniref:UDP-2,4-diacetamido-2,4, 6-trideoxy-beta-L-altropyranose hydrolase n=1 Tax=Ectopseudomonas alcaliphila TaxID=101564 RepID=UPI00277E2942|nr:MULTISPECIES: UDP-2,4-diacetamido-2,4,6-trideoxy-beta-L-altropyranose hydrolase [Pseudomonas]MDP9940100.1 UDP-2,4-diacetamido-2,4,6-trideoxy-beta-L-altropyranose hydrolase [Pseudomonas sp. 3400]MDR7012333.1 UDP-2,4-diacetamido-2,4,6-trideoxy-beta-L-altropyranose hydrolase [Pseudomonas alcaliphila]